MGKFFIFRSKIKSIFFMSRFKRILLFIIIIVSIIIIKQYVTKQLNKPTLSLFKGTV